MIILCDFVVHTDSSSDVIRLTASSGWGWVLTLRSALRNILERECYSAQSVLVALSS
jgi:hypothetical protein